MAITTYSELQTAIANWLDRTDLTSRIPEFIELAEARIKRDMRRGVTREALSLTSGEVALPATLAELSSLRLNTGTDYKDQPVKIVTPERLAELRSQHSDSGVPRFASVVDGTLLLVPAPDQTYASEVIYFTKYVALSVSAPTNETLTEAPDLLLFGSLAEASPYLEHDERVQLWEAKYDRAVAGLNRVRQNEEYGASLRPVRLPVTLG